MSFKVKDHYYKKAKEQNYLARSIFKLEEINKKYSVIHKKDRALDLGYYPGSWTQYLSQLLKKSEVVAIDIQEIHPKIKALDNVRVYQKDIFNINELADIGQTDPFDVVVSDMAPKTTGVKTVDQLKSLGLVEKVWDILPLFLKVGGNFVIKVFESQEAQDFFKENRKTFGKINFLRPKSTRSVSKEYFAIGLNYKGPNESN